MTNHNFKKISTPRVCVLISSFFPIVGGGESHALLLSEELISQGATVFVLTRRRVKGSLKFEYINQIPVYRVWPDGFQRWGKYLMMISAFLKLITLRNKYDIIYVCGLRILGIVGVISAVLLNKKCILRAESLGEMSGEFIWGSPTPPKRYIWIKIINLILKLRYKIYIKATCFVSISNAISREFKTCNIPPKINKLISNGIDTYRFSPVDQAQKIKLREKFNISKSMVFCYTGKLNRMKGLELLLSVWNEVTKEYKNIYLLLVGSGRYQVLSCEDELLDFVNKNNLQQFVRFTGYTDDVDKYLQSSDVFVLPSESESLSLSLLEAMSCQLPVISTRCGGPNDIVEDHKNGILIDVNSFDELKQSILYTINNYEMCKQMGKVARTTVLERFSIQHIARQHITLFQSLLH